MQAITTQYHAPTNTQGSRIVAKCAAGRITVGYDHSKDNRGNAAAACAALVAKLDWSRYGAWTGGETHDGSFAFTCPDLHDKTLVVG